jgi:branched-chain amino acid transport system ATP-binding protein
MLRIKNCESGYGKLRVLKGVSLHVGKGEIVTIIGANGAGKTTLLSTIAGVVRARGGEIRFNDEDIRAAPPHDIVARGCCLVPEGRRLFAPMTVEENLLLGAYTQLRKRNTAFVKKEMERVYAMFPVLRERRRQLAGTLSGGEQQMLAIARSLMSSPRLLMLDEPTLGLAPVMVDKVRELILSLKGRGMTVLLAEQNVEMALSVSDRAYVLENGRVAMTGASGALANDETVRSAYLGL